MKSTLLNLGVFALLIGAFAMIATDGHLPGLGKPADSADWCAIHQTALSTCVPCNPLLARGGTVIVRDRQGAEGGCPNTHLKITLGSGAAEHAGIELHTVEARPLSVILTATGETRHPPSRHARVTPRAPGVVREVRVTVGDDVKAGAVLVILDSSEAARRKSDFLQALSILRFREESGGREKELFEKKLTTFHDLQEALTALDEARLTLTRARQALLSLGFTEADIDSIRDRQDTGGELAVMAPIPGTVEEMAVVIGESIEEGRTLFTIADPDLMWVAIGLHDTDLPKVCKGQKVRFTMEGLPGQRFQGKVIAIAGDVDPRARTVEVLAEVENQRRLLRANMFGTAEIVVKSAEPKILIPREAVQYDGDCHLVFISPAPDVFQAREVELGAIYGDGYEIVSGLAPGQKIATTGSYLLKTEVLRGQMGVG